LKGDLFDMNYNKYTIIGGAVGISILIIAIGVFLAPRGEQRESGDENRLTPIAQQTPQPARPRTYQEFVKSGRSEVCQFVSTIEGVVTTGTVYAAHGKIRTDFATTYDNGTAHQHMVVDSYITYLWSNGSNRGVKFAVEEADTSATEDVFGKNAQCREQKVDLSVFELPADVAFTDITGL
jgi:hypothetical protein